MFAMLAALVPEAHAQIRVPGSTSSDQETALYYDSLPAPANDRKFEFYFLRSESLSRLSGQLVPDVSGKVLGADPAVMNDWDTGNLLKSIGDDIHSMRSGTPRDPAFSYYVAWSPDSRWVSIEGGAHKFWHWMVYHLVDGRFQQVTPPNHEFVDYYRGHLPHLRIQHLGVKRRIPHRSYDPPCVCWPDNGIVAVDARQYLLDEESYYDGSAPHPEQTFFFLDCRAKPVAKILGFCQ